MKSENFTLKNFIQLEEKYMYDKWKNKLTEDRFYNPNFSKKGWFMLDKADKKKKQ